MFWRILTQSLRHRWSRLTIAFLAVAMGASLAAAALSVSVGMEEKVGRTLRAYGANIVLVPQGGALGEVNATLDERALAPLSQNPALLGYAPFLYVVGEVKGQPVVLVGTPLDAARRVNPWWQVEGRLPAGADDTFAIIGAHVAAKWRAKTGDSIAVRSGGLSKTFRIIGALSTGGAEDDQILVSLSGLQQWLKRPDQVSLVQVSALATQAPLEETAHALEQAIPEAEAKTVRQIGEGEVALVRRVQLLLGVIAGIVLVAAAVSVGATMTTVMLERQREVGLMKAIGAEQWRVRTFFLAEAAALGACGGIAGYALGLGLAQLIAQSVFASGVAPHLWVGLTALALGMLIALLGSAIPVQRALSVQPAAVLRGE